MTNSNAPSKHCTCVGMMEIPGCTHEYVCGWRCGDTNPDHKHYAVSVRENGRLLGRLTPSGGAARNNVYAAILSHSTATKVSEEINAQGVFTAKVIPF